MKVSRVRLLKGRVSHGTRGLKPQRFNEYKSSVLSRLSRDARIETSTFHITVSHCPSRVSHGTRGLKHSTDSGIIPTYGRVSHGTRGLKLLSTLAAVISMQSRLSRDARIETPQNQGKTRRRQSRLSRDARIETTAAFILSWTAVVASLTGRED